MILDNLFSGVEESATLVIVLHAGTLGSILVVYWRRILDLLSRERRVIGLLVLGTLPAAVVGLSIKRGFPRLIESPPLAAGLLLVTGLLLLVLGRLRPRDGQYSQMSWLGAVVVGCFQAVAVLPGISRSGSTILGGRLMGLSNEDSVTFSFLLAIPAILGATVLTMKDLLDGSEPASDLPIATLLVGALCAFVVGIVALKWLIRWSREARLHWFAYWCIPFGIAMSLWYAM